jgi:hypothetical protein
MCYQVYNNCDGIALVWLWLSGDKKGDSCGKAHGTPVAGGKIISNIHVGT